MNENWQSIDINAEMTELLELYDKEVSGKNASARNYKHI
jgi:hypothetical protein